MGDFHFDVTALGIISCCCFDLFILICFDLGFYLA